MAWSGAAWAGQGTSMRAAEMGGVTVTSVPGGTGP